MEDFKKLLKNCFKGNYKSSFELIFEIFASLELNLLDENYFLNNASSVIERIREISFQKLKNKEKNYVNYVFEHLFKESKIDDSETKELITNFFQKFHEHLYLLNLSITQSRRSRSGKEFESIIELIFNRSNVPMERQGLIKNKNLRKLVDFISPSSVEYYINKDKVVLISLKTTLRERWQKVIDEIKSADVSGIYLITLDDNISQNLLSIFKEWNIHIVTTKVIKERVYSKNLDVITIEDLLQICKQNYLYWDNYEYSEKDLRELEKLSKKYSRLEVVQKFCLRKMKKVKG